MSEDQKKEEKNAELDVYDMLIKQQELILKQSDQLSHERELKKAEDDEIDLRRLIPRFLRKRPEKERSESNLLSAGQLAGRIAGRGLEKSKGFLYYTSSLVHTYLLGLKRYAVFVALATVLGFAYGLYAFFYAEKVYESRMLVNPSNLEQEFYFSLLEGLNKVSHNKDKSELAKKLKLSHENAEKIKGVYYGEYYEYMVVSKEATDSTEAVIEYPFFEVTVHVSDNSVLPVLETNMFNFLAKNEYSENKRKIKRNILRNDIAQFEKEMVLIDSLKQSVIDRISKKGQKDSYFVKESSLAPQGIILSQQEKLEIEPLEPFNKSLQLHASRSTMDEELLNLDTDFLLIDGFGAIDAPVFPRLRHVFQYVTMTFIAASILSAIMALFWGNRKQVDE